MEGDDLTILHKGANLIDIKMEVAVESHELMLIAIFGV